MRMSAQLAKITLSCWVRCGARGWAEVNERMIEEKNAKINLLISSLTRPSHLMERVHRSQGSSGILTVLLNLWPTGAPSSIWIQPEMGSRLKQLSESLPSRQIRHWYFPPWFAAT